MTVHLVGAGPGDPGLLTVRAAELIARADVILYDRLIPERALDGARAGAELIYVGKEGGGPQMPQEEINRLIVEHGRAGKEVVRLKGGDPFVFGRGGEEALVCAEAGIPFAVVPGITAGVAAPAYAGVPVTHRELASGVAFVTGHENPEKPETALDWPALAAFPGTLVFYMGVRALPRIADAADRRRPRRRTSRSRSSSRARCRGQRTLLATLGTWRSARRPRGSARPRSRSSGRSRGCASSSPGSSARPLHGRSVAVTRARPQASALAARLRELGATVIEAPAIRMEPVAAALPDLARLRPRLRHVAERRARAVGAAGGGRARRAGAGRRAARRDRAGDGARAARARAAGGRRARAGGGRGAGRGARGRAGAARAAGARPRGARRAARRAARAGRRGRGARALRDRGGADRATRSAPSPRTT